MLYKKLQLFLLLYKQHNTNALSDYEYIVKNSIAELTKYIGSKSEITTPNGL